MKILFLDDDESRQSAFKEWFDEHKTDLDTLVQTRTANDTIKALKSNKLFDIVSLDHDLGGKVFVTETKETGYEVALYIERMGKKKLPKSVVIHSFNPTGASRMMQAIKKRVPNTQYLPFCLPTIKDGVI